jgi:signal transduction histidine kinase
VAQAHGGDVTVASIEGQGSTFHLTLSVGQVADASLAHEEA